MTLNVSENGTTREVVIRMIAQAPHLVVFCVLVWLFFEHTKEQGAMFLQTVEDIRSQCHTIQERSSRAMERNADAVLELSKQVGALSRQIKDLGN